MTVPEIVSLKAKRKIVMLTAYDYSTAKILDSTGKVDIILVGDSLGMVVLGYENTLPVTLDDIIHHSRAVRRGVENAVVVADMPFLSYQVSVEEALRNAGRVVKETGVDAVKIEGGKEVADTVRKLVETGIPVMGHIGLCPQKVKVMGGMKRQGRDEKQAEQIIENAVALEEAGVFSIVLESVPVELADEITRKVSVPTIGIGSGWLCDGQVLVINDMLGTYPDFKPKHTRVYADVGKVISDAVERFADDVINGRFPSEKESFHIKR